ncbi:macrophage mannose receptor 1 isoform X2 [Labeo rohita]|nr:macrophage mannose receptor 1 isoform X2 [Labeo rohita]
MRIDDALRACKDNHTDLVTIYDKEWNTEQAKLLVNGSNNCSLIGANGCTWSDGEPVTFINLSRIFTEEKCCGALTTGGKWECVNCTSRMYFMCYKKKGQDQTPFYSLIPENKTWFEAQLYCRENHTDLVTIRNEEENQLVKNAVNGSDSIWIGLRYNYSVAWTDAGQSGYKEKCFRLLSNRPNESCETKKSTCAALCYKRFIHVSPVYATWEQALDHCDKKFAGLLRFESEDDQTETERELKRQNISGPVWVGLRQSRLFGFWIWSNGLYVGNWIKWKGGSPPEHQMSQHCGALEKRVNDTFELSDKDCRSEFRFLCEVK